MVTVTVVTIPTIQRQAPFTSSTDHLVGSRQYGRSDNLGRRQSMAFAGCESWRY
jgi:hypothetical protein